jgi:cysteate synthase
MAAFLLRCSECGREYDGCAAFRLRCEGEMDGSHGPALLSARYACRQLTFRDELPGIFKFADWLPTGPYVLSAERGAFGEPCCFRSEALAGRLGLRNLYIGFSGYWPERGANLVTRTFKEFEVQASLACILQAKRAHPATPIIVASAGNTANGYTYYTHLLGLPLYLFVPRSGLGNLLLPFEAYPTLIVVDGDYSDAIVLADGVARNCGLTRDGGVLNPGRRAGMGTVMLNAVCHPRQGPQRLFDHYFQAVGSGSGAIAAWEAVQLLLGDGRFGGTPTRIHVAQNEPFVPIIRAWKDAANELQPTFEQEARSQVAAVSAMVLTNRNPPYGVAGGLRDVLRRSNGFAWSVNNESVFNAARMFYSLEGVDIGPAAAVALDALCQAVAAGSVKPKDYVLLHITGGGREMQYSEGPVFRTRALLEVKPDGFDAVISLIGKPAPINVATMAQALSRYEPS